jgi:transcriptional/translational regulatory protein YebC/TACO1
VSQQLKEMKIPVENAELVMTPQNEIALPQNDSVKVLRLIDELEDLEDVRRVFSNLEMTEDAVEAYAAVAA